MNRNRRNRSVAFTTDFSRYRFFRGLIPFAIALLVTLVVFKLNLSSLSNPDIATIQKRETTIPEENFDLNLAGKTLEDLERQRIANVLNVPIPNYPVPLDRTPRFILHDTAWNMSANNIREQQLHAKGPMGLGPNVYVPRGPNAAVKNIIDSIARPFFEPHRPTATHYEQAAEILPTETRDQLARAVWRQTPENIRTAALSDALKDVPTSYRSPKELQRRSRMWFNASSEGKFESIAETMPTHYFDGAKTAALWATREICRQSANKTCDRLRPVFEERDKRVASSVNVEIVQLEGSHCDTTGNLKGLPGYTDYQYRETAKLYLYAALQAGQFPEIISHYAADSFLLDQGKSPHCDPRGFDLQRLYDEIGQVAGYPVGKLYGITPRYGTDPRNGVTIWWERRVFGRSAPV
ncbi:hypothetical protein V0288_06740 [Pannus brasiliensis CCIBt3594]|uniref:Uncharacterized protein n=1 Tax=Pannus brasiliensis CCIBt3594 TaxID=1427578 RepID=A0AAW9QIA8_9CHRO